MTDDRKKVVGFVGQVPGTIQNMLFKQQLVNQFGLPITKMGSVDNNGNPIILKGFPGFAKSIYEPVAASVPGGNVTAFVVEEDNYQYPVGGDKYIGLLKVGTDAYRWDRAGYFSPYSGRRFDLPCIIGYDPLLDVYITRQQTISDPYEEHLQHYNAKTRALLGSGYSDKLMTSGYEWSGFLAAEKKTIGSVKKYAHWSVQETQSMRCLRKLELSGDSVSNALIPPTYPLGTTKILLPNGNVVTYNGVGTFLQAISNTTALAVIYGGSDTVEGARITKMRFMTYHSIPGYWELSEEDRTLYVNTKYSIKVVLADINNPAIYEVVHTEESPECTYSVNYIVFKTGNVGDWIYQPNYTYGVDWVYAFPTGTMALWGSYYWDPAYPYSHPTFYGPTGLPPTVDAAYNNGTVLISIPLTWENYCTSADLSYYYYAHSYVAGKRFAMRKDSSGEWKKVADIPYVVPDVQADDPPEYGRSGYKFWYATQCKAHQIFLN